MRSDAGHSCTPAFREGLCGHLPQRMTQSGADAGAMGCGGLLHLLEQFGF
jgi:hypothetical protein